jgi:hypothetical protein
MVKGVASNNTSCLLESRIIYNDKLFKADGPKHSCYSSIFFFFTDLGQNKLGSML